MRRMIILAALLLAPISAIACHDATGPAAGPAATVAIAGGDGQTAATGTRLSLPLLVKVTDAKGQPVRGARVTWAVDPLGGVLDSDASVTDNRGIAGVNWGVGANAGEWTVTATVEGLPPAVFHATATGPVTLTLVQPLPGDTVDSLNLVVVARGAAAASGVVAWIGDTQLAMHADSQIAGGVRYRLDLPLTGALADDHPVLVIAGDDEGNTAMVRTDVHHDAAPEVSLPQPLPCTWNPALLAGTTRVVAACRDDGGGCRNVEVAVNGRVLASGRDSAVAEFPASTLAADSARFTVRGTGAHGVTRTLTTPVFWVERSPRFTLLARVPGRLTDGDDDRALYEVSGPVLGSYYTDETLIVRELATGHDTAFAGGVALWDGAVTRAGAIVQAQPSFISYHRLMGVWLLGSAPSPGTSAFHYRATDDWVAWVTDRIVRTAVGSGWQTAMPTKVHGGDDDYTLADDGTIAYVAPVDGIAQLFVMHPSGSVEQVTYDTATAVAFGQAEANRVLYDRYTRGPGAQEHQVVLRTPDGEHLLTTPSRDDWKGLFTLRDGYVLLKVDTAGAREFRIRTPDGEVIRVGPPVSTAGAHASLGLGGAVVIGAGGRLYYAAPPAYVLQDVGRDYYFQEWHRGRLYSVTCNALFRIDP